MVVSLDSVKRAVCSFMETDILYKAPEHKRFVIGAMIMMAPKIVEKKYSDWKDYISMMEIGTGEGQIDIDRAESLLCELMGKYGNYQMDLMGTRICINQDDVHKVASLARSL